MTDARMADITDIDALRALSVGDVDVAVVATADLEASVLAIMNLKQFEGRRGVREGIVGPSPTDPAASRRAAGHSTRARWRGTLCAHHPGCGSG